MAKKTSGSTPLMDQYLQIKAKHRDKILLYRMGDFYETFYEDARIIAKILGIALTKRAHGKSADVPLAGFPYHALDNYLHKLVQAGHRVAICEQTENPRQAKGIVKRDVIEVVTPGATLSEKLLDHKNNNFLAALQLESGKAGMAFADISTGEFYVCEVSEDQIRSQLASFNPKELLLKKSRTDHFRQLTGDSGRYLLTPREEWIFSPDYAAEILKDHFNVHSLKGYGLDPEYSGLVAAGVIVNYLRENYQSSLIHLRRLRILNLSEYMVLDDATRRNLEIRRTLREDIGGNTLLDVLDQTRTAMGGRCLRQWINQPLRSTKKITERHEVIAGLAEQPELLNDLQRVLNDVSDIERLIGKIATGRANARDLVSLKQALNHIPELAGTIGRSDLKPLQKQFDKLKPLPVVTELIANAIVDNPPITITEGGMIRSGYHAELDELNRMTHHGKEWIAGLQVKERKRTGITTLKINYNKVFGYYIEVSKIHLNKIPDDYIRKQTLVNAERFITPELKEREDKILGADEKLKALEYDLLQEIRGKIAEQTTAIQRNSELIARLDCLCGLADVAARNNYTRPVMTDARTLMIRNGRHPVVERFMKPGEAFVPNDVFLEPDQEQIWIITGPNMAGKSTFLRQIGLIVFMAQIGSFVPADNAEIGIVDRIFTRVGASDNLASGESTFLVEMNETANIMHNASPASLILLDEIGRGTSTFDGLAIAWAVTEYLHKENNVRAKTLFATHYHELTELAVLYPRIRNYNIAVEELDREIIFLRKIVPGGTDNSYGIHVAQMAGLPGEVIERAREILSNLEANELTPNRLPKLAQKRAGRQTDQNQLSLFINRQPSRVEQHLRGINIDSLTPLDALVKLNELKKMLKESDGV